ncbi:MAG: hypothetical protein KDK71_02215 [Chlamydiia bacterium]|nr:hypothetical protein [Chlamydiia bacterium]
MMITAFPPALTIFFLKETPAEPTAQPIAEAPQAVQEEASKVSLKAFFLLFAISIPLLGLLGWIYLAVSHFSTKESFERPYHHTFEAGSDADPMMKEALKHVTNADVEGETYTLAKNMDTRVLTKRPFKLVIMEQEVTDEHKPKEILDKLKSWSDSEGQNFDLSDPFAVAQVLLTQHVLQPDTKEEGENLMKQMQFIAKSATTEQTVLLSKPNTETYQITMTGRFDLRDVTQPTQPVKTMDVTQTYTITKQNDGKPCMVTVDREVN